MKTLFTALEPGDLHQQYKTELSALLSHQNAATKSLALHELMCIASDPQRLSALFNDIDLLVGVIKTIGDDDLCVAKSAMEIVKKIGKHPNGIKLLYKGELLRCLARLLAENDAVTFRTYEVIVDIAKSSREVFDASVQSGFLNSLINIMENEDILLQLNALEVMTELALTSEGLHYLEEQNVLKKLVEKIAKADENPLSNLLIPGLMKFFGNVSRCKPYEIFSKYPIVVSALFEVIESGDQAILSTALDTLGHVASTVEGKYALQDLGNSMPSALKQIAKIIQTFPTDLRIRALNCLTQILYVEKSEHDNKLLSLTKSWFDCLCDDSLGMTIGLCKQPFADIRQASLEVLGVIASQMWGQECMATYPGLVEFLLDRNIESFKECKEAKYEVVKHLSQAEQGIFDANTTQKFKQFVKEGPLFVETYTEVALEGAS